MGASESTGRSDATETSGAAMVIAVAAAGAVVVAWGISKMLADNTKSHEKDDIMQGMQYGSAKGQSSGYGGSNHDDSYFTYEAKQNIMWHPPSPGGFKMNTDAKSKDGEKAYAGVLRDDHGKWVRGFIGWYRVDDGILKAEIYGIYKGLKLLVEQKKKGCVLESDSEQGVFWTRKENRSYEHPEKTMSHCSKEIIECWKLASENKILIQHVGRDANKCADQLVDKVAFKRKQDYEEILQLPDEIKDIVDQERVRTFLA